MERPLSIQPSCAYYCVYACVSVQRDLHVSEKRLINILRRKDLGGFLIRQRAAEREGSKGLEDDVRIVDLFRVQMQYVYNVLVRLRRKRFRL